MLHMNWVNNLKTVLAFVKLNIAGTALFVITFVVPTLSNLALRRLIPPSALEIPWAWSKVHKFKDWSLTRSGRALWPSKKVIKWLSNIKNTKVHTKNVAQY
jgi:hypothetical protein